MPYCNLGCTFVRDENETDKSYTCLLQKEMYKEDPERYPPLRGEKLKRYVEYYLLKNKFFTLKKSSKQTPKKRNITPELLSDENTLSALIMKDEILQTLYSHTLFYIEIDDKRYTLKKSSVRKK